MTAAGDFIDPATVVPQRLPWRTAWHVIVSSHLERQAGRLVTVNWPVAEHRTCRVYYDGRQWHATIEQVDHMPVDAPVRHEREGKRLIERHIAAVRATLRATIKP